MSNTTTPEYLTFIRNVAEALPSTYSMIQAVFMLLALMVLFSAVMDLAQSTDRQKKFFASGRQPTYWGGVAKIIIAGFMFTLGANLQMVSIAASIYQGEDNAISLVTIESYVPNNANEGLEAKYTKIALLGVAQIVGILAVFKGLRIWAKISDASSRESAWHGFAYIVFGSMCVQLTWVGKVVENTLGFNFFSIIGLG